MPATFTSAHAARAVFAAELPAFWDSGAGAAVKAAFVVAGCLIGVFGVFRAIAAFSGQKTSNGFKILFSTIVLCAFLFRPELLNELLELVSEVVKSVLKGSAEVIENAPGGPGDSPSSVPR